MFTRRLFSARQRVDPVADRPVFVEAFVAERSQKYEPVSGYEQENRRRYNQHQPNPDDQSFFHRFLPGSTWDRSAANVPLAQAKDNGR